MRWLRPVLGVSVALVGAAFVVAGGAMAWLLVLEPWFRPDDPGLTTMVYAWGVVITAGSPEAVICSTAEMLVGLAVFGGGWVVVARRPLASAAPAAPPAEPKPSAISRISDRIAHASDRLKRASDRLAAHASDRLPRLGTDA